MAKIIVKRREGDQTIALTAVETVIGRSSSCTMPLKDGTLSRNHCKITLTPQGFVVSDMGSRNGTTVNDTLVKEKKLEPGDRIDIGNSVLVFEREIPGRDYGPRKEEAAPQSGIKAPPAADTVIVRKRQRKEEDSGDFASWATSSEGAPSRLAPAVLVVAVCALIAFVIFRSKTSVAPVAPKGDAVETADFEGTRTPAGLPEGWVKGSPNGVVRVVEGVCRSGKASLRIEKSDPKELVSTCVHQSRTRVPAGSLVELTGSVRAEGVSGACGLRLALYRTETDTIPASERYGLVPPVGEPGRSAAFTSDWQEVSVGAAAVGEDMFAEFGCACVGFSGAANFDDLALFIRAGACDGSALAHFSAGDSVMLAGDDQSLTLRRGKEAQFVHGMCFLRGPSGESVQVIANIGKPGASRGKHSGAMFNPDGAGVADFSQELFALGGSFRIESAIAEAQAPEFGFRCVAGGKGGEVACVVHSVADAQTQKGEFRNASGLLLDVQVEGARFWLKSEEPLQFSCVKAGETWLVECVQTRGAGTASTRRLRLEIGAGAPTAEALVLKRVRFEDAAKAESSGSLGSALTQYSVFLKQSGSRDEERAQAEVACRALVRQAEDSLALAAAKLSEAQVVQDAKAAKEAVTIAETGAKAFADSEYGAQFEALRAQADAFQAELGQGRRAQEAQRLLQIADAYMQEEKTHLAMAYYRYLAGNFVGTEWGNRAQENLDKIGK